MEGLADALAAAMRAEPLIGPSLVQLDDGRAPPARMLRLTIDQTSAHELGLTKGRVARLAAVLDGRRIGDHRPSEGEVDLKLRSPSYSIIWGSMASTFVTGLATATLLILFIVPLGWGLITEAAERRAARRLRVDSSPVR